MRDLSELVNFELMSAGTRVDCEKSHPLRYTIKMPKSVICHAPPTRHEQCRIGNPTNGIRQLYTDSGAEVNSQRLLALTISSSE